MKRLFAILMLLIAFSWACNSPESSNTNQSMKSELSLVEKRIKQKLVVDAMGFIKSKDFDIENVDKVDDTTFQVIYNFLNPMIDQEIRLTKNYVFSIDLDSIINDIDLKSEMKVEGEWVESNF